jgi:hypothetical protein
VHSRLTSKTSASYLGDRTQSQSREDELRTLNKLPSRFINCLQCCLIAFVISVSGGSLAAQQDMVYFGPDGLLEQADPTIPAANPVPRATGILVGLPNPTPMQGSPRNLTIKPQVSLAIPSTEGDENWMINRRPSSNLSGVDAPFVMYQEPLPPPRPNVTGGEPVPMAPVTVIETQAEPIFDSIAWSRPMRRGILERRVTGEGMGIERLPFGLFDIDPAQPSNNFRMRGVFASGMNLPDRAGYFWNRTRDGKGPPLGESAIDYQEFRLRMEAGSKNFSTAFEVPLRRVDPALNTKRTGLSDLQLATKLVLIRGDEWIISQYMGFRFPTGKAREGLGAGSVGLEPGLLFRSRLRDQTWMHCEVKFWFPLGADPIQKGEVIKIASGLNTVWRETDCSALIPSLEMSSFIVTRGLARDATQIERRVNEHFILNLTPGVHYTVDRKGDFGLFDFGTAVSFATTTQRFADATFLLEARWFW